MTFNLWPSSTVRSTSRGLCTRSPNDFKEKNASAGRSEAQRPGYLLEPALPWRPWTCGRVWAPRRTPPQRSSKPEPGTWSSRTLLECVKETNQPQALPESSYLCADVGSAELTDFVVNAALQVAHVDPALLLLHFWVVVQNLVSEPRQVIHSQFVLFTCRKGGGWGVQGGVCKQKARLKVSRRVDLYLIWLPGRWVPPGHPSAGCGVD